MHKNKTITINDSMTSVREYVYINGEYTDKKDAKILPTDRGYRYGDGVFETMLFNNKTILLADFHLDRLALGLRFLKIDYKIDGLIDACIKLINLNNQQEGYIRLQITRGGKSSGYLPLSSEANIYIEILPPRDLIFKKVELVISKYKRGSSDLWPAGIKSCQGLISTLAIMEAKELNVDEAIMLNEKNEISECSSTNIFIVKDSEFFTPPKESGLVEGVVRRYILENYQNVKEKSFGLEELKAADEVFITSAGRLVSSVSKIHNLNSYKDSSVARRIFEALYNLYSGNN